MKSEKLTLQMEAALIEKAKRVAKKRGTSVSGMVAGFFEGLEGTRPSNHEFGQITNQLRGSLRPKDDSLHSGKED